MILLSINSFIFTIVWQSIKQQDSDQEKLTEIFILIFTFGDYHAERPICPNTVLEINFFCGKPDI